MTDDTAMFLRHAGQKARCIHQCKKRDIEAITEANETRTLIGGIYVEHTGQDYETVERTLDRDHFMTAQEAREFGLIDKVYSSRDALEAEGTK